MCTVSDCMPTIDVSEAARHARDVRVHTRSIHCYRGVDRLCESMPYASCPVLHDLCILPAVLTVMQCPFVCTCVCV